VTAAPSRDFSHNAKGATPTVAIDVRMMGYTGIGTYLRALVPRIVAARPDWRFILLGAANGEHASLSSDRVQLAACSSDIYSIAEQLELPLKVPSRASLLWSPHYNIPVLSRVPLVVTVHDVCHLALPQFYGGGARAAYAKGMFAAVRRQAAAIIFDSSFSEQEFRRLVGEPASGTTIHIGVDEGWHAPRDVAEASPHPRPYLLAIGGPKPHKNLTALLRAYESLGESIEHDLVIIGDQGRVRTRDDQFLTLAGKLAPRVRLQDPVDDETLRRFVAHAEALVFPSLYEGFGLPALEAMAAGCPTLVSSAGSLPEICGDASLYCDPMNPADIAAQIVRLVRDRDLRTALVRAGRARATLFRWDVTAEKTACVLENAMRI
jgi:glycosyltransferase involved in cell wall biosynthesis